MCEHGILNLKEEVDTNADFDLYMDEYNPHQVKSLQVKNMELQMRFY